MKNQFENNFQKSKVLRTLSKYLTGIFGVGDESTKGVLVGDRKEFIKNTIVNNDLGDVYENTPSIPIIK